MYVSDTKTGVSRIGTSSPWNAGIEMAMKKNRYVEGDRRVVRYYHASPPALPPRRRADRPARGRVRGGDDGHVRGDRGPV